MKILKAGNPQRLKFYGTCRECLCEFELEKDEPTKKDVGRDPSYSYDCPQAGCGQKDVMVTPRYVPVDTIPVFQTSHKREFN